MKLTQQQLDKIRNQIANVIVKIDYDKDQINAAIQVKADDINAVIKGFDPSQTQVITDVVSKELTPPPAPVVVPPDPAYAPITDKFEQSFSAIFDVINQAHPELSVSEQRSFFKQWLNTYLNS